MLSAGNSSEAGRRRQGAAINRQIQMKIPTPAKAVLIRSGWVGAAVLCSAFCGLQAQTITNVVNAASLQSQLAPGTLANVSGANLGESLSTAVTVGDKSAAVVKASPEQFIIQIPFDAPLGGTTIRVGNSASFPVTLGQFAPALFTENGTGSGNISAIHADGTPIDVNNPAFPLESISLFATGLGPTLPPLPTGVPGPENPPAVTATQPTVLYASETAKVLSSVMAPGQVGIYRITIQLTAALVTGIRNIGMTIGGVSSGYSVTIPVATAYATPVITKVLSATGIPGSAQENIEAGSWVAIYGFDLAKAILDWTYAIKGTRLPIALDGVRVTIDGKPAAVYFVSPSQINVQAPDAVTGAVQVVVTNNGIASAPATAQVRTHAPAFFQSGAANYAVATRHPDYAFVGGPSQGLPWTPAKAGDILVLWATGFGPTIPPLSPGVINTIAAVTETLPVVTVGGINVPVIGAALSPGLVGVYQVAIQIPTGIPAGDAMLKATIGGFESPDNVYIYIAPD